MFTDPQAVTVNAVAKSLPRVSSGDFQGAFRSSADGLTLRISHQAGRRNRSTVRLDVEKTSADPLVPSTNRPYSMSVWCTIDTPPQGFSTTEIGYYIAALTDWMDLSANQAKLLNQEA